MNKSQNVPVWLSKMVLAKHFCDSLLRLPGTKAQRSLTPAVDWLDSLISLGRLLVTSTHTNIDTRCRPIYIQDQYRCRPVWDGYLIFLITYQFQVFEKNQNQRTTDCRYLKQFGIKEPPESGYVKKNQNQRTAGSG
jgi:hypothetical protein